MLSVTSSDLQANKNLWMKVPMIMRQKRHNCIEIEIKYSKSNILFKLFKVSQMLINSSENAYIIRMSRYEIREAFKKKNL